MAEEQDNVTKLHVGEVITEPVTVEQPTQPPVTVEVVAETVPVAEVVPSNVYKLSSGHRVKIESDMLDSISQMTITHTFSKTNMDNEGKLVDDGDNNSRIGLALAMFNYNSSLLSAVNGQFERVVTLYDGLPKAKGWKQWMKTNPMVAESHPHLDLSSPEDQEFLFLRYFAFASEEDWKLLSDKLLNT